MECVDKRLIEALDVVVWRADNGGEGRLGLREEIFCVPRSSHSSDGKGDFPTRRETGRERSGERRDQAVVSAVMEVQRYLN